MYYFHYTGMVALNISCMLSMHVVNVHSFMNLLKYEMFYEICNSYINL
jgi:hypothetical protein